jgi:hypothetical protein
MRFPAFQGLCQTDTAVSGTKRGFLVLAQMRLYAVSLRSAEPLAQPSFLAVWQNLLRKKQALWASGR